MDVKTPKVQRCLTDGVLGESSDPETIEFHTTCNSLQFFRRRIDVTVKLVTQIEKRSWTNIFLCLCVFLAICALSFVYFHPCSEDKVCYPRVGCFETSGPWSERPNIFNFFPQSPVVINTTFIVTSRYDPNGQRVAAVSAQSPMRKLHNFHWNSGQFLFFIIHGYTDDSSTWMQTLKDSILALDDVTVVLVDWKSGASGYYPQVVANTRVVAREIHIFVTHYKREFPSKRIHLIGHSLGSHIASYVGKDMTYPKRIYQITALDPAFPLFEAFQSKIRLHKKDARHVLVIHSNIGPWGLGMEDPVGTLDIYLNNGRDQRGCTPMPWIIREPLQLERKTMNLNSFTDNLKDLLACSHRRAYEILEDILWSLNGLSSNSTFVAYPMFLEGKEKVIEQSLCTENKNGTTVPCWKLDWDTKNSFFQFPSPFITTSTSNFFMPTTEKSPFCVRFALLQITTCEQTPLPLSIQSPTKKDNYHIRISYFAFGEEVAIYNGGNYGHQQIDAWVEFSCDELTLANSVRKDYKLAIQFSVTFTLLSKQTKSGISSFESMGNICWETLSLTYYTGRKINRIHQKNSEPRVPVNECFVYWFNVSEVRQRRKS